MIDELIRLLQESGADAWTIEDECRQGWEFYLIRHSLDQNRARRTEQIRLTVFRRMDDGQNLGSAAAQIMPTATIEQVRTQIGQLMEEALLVRNPYYEIVRPSGVVIPPAAAPDIRAIAGDYLSALAAVPESAEADLNSCEIFCDSIRRRFISSTGVDVTSVYPSSMLEAIINARQEGHEIEIYRCLHSGTCDRSELRQVLVDAMQYGRDRLRAVPTPAIGQAAVVFSTEAAVEVYRWFISHLDAGMKVQRFSDWEIGRCPFPDIRGDRVSIMALRHLANSSHDYAYDAEGSPVRDVVLMRDMVPERFFGSCQFSHYLGMKDSFIPGNYAVSGGTVPAAELRNGRYLEVVEFSDFQVSPLDGSMAGEIRLGYWHDGTQTTPVTGGSVSGYMGELACDMRMSAETARYDSMQIPAVTRIEHVSIAGRE